MRRRKKRMLIPLSRVTSCLQVFVGLIFVSFIGLVTNGIYTTQHMDVNIAVEVNMDVLHDREDHHGRPLEDPIDQEVHLEETRKSKLIVRVGVYNGFGASAKSWQNVLRVLECESDVDFQVQTIRNASREVIHKDNIDVFLIGGGTAQLIGGWHRKKSENLKSTLRSFLAQGGGFVGICAGAYLGSHEANNLTPFPIKHGLLGVGHFKVDGSSYYYANGPIFHDKANETWMAQESLTSPKVLMHLKETDKLVPYIPSKHAIPKEFEGTALVTLNQYMDKGRVVLSSIHPETNAMMKVAKPAPTCDSAAAKLLQKLVVIAAVGEMEVDFSTKT